MQQQVIEEIRQRLADVNIVSFSGGKDSSVVLDLVFQAIRDTEKKLLIITADTLMEIPYFQEYVDGVREKIKTFLAGTNANAEVVLVRPQYADSFWVSVLGKGYPAAHMGFRWCTGKLKIDPISQYTKQATSGGSFTVFVGVRAAESALRARIYKQKDYKKNHFAPILDWSSADVWEQLMTTPSPWSDHSKLIEVYKYSSDECVYGEKEGVCVGNARYGCWACPLQRSGQLEMIGYHTNDSRYTLLRGFKETLVGMANNRSLRSITRRNGTKGSGPFLVSIRRRLLRDLLDIQEKTGWSLITAQEVSYIHEEWEKDSEKHNIGDPQRPMLWNLEDMTIFSPVPIY
jgi:DNA sulfur modification protein DndC